MQPNLRNLQHTVDIFDVAFDLRDKIPGRLDSPRVQRGPQGAGQSPGHASNYVIERRRIFGAADLPAIFLLIEISDAAVNAEMNGFLEVFNVGRAVRSLVLFDSDATGMCNGHADLPGRPTLSSGPRGRRLTRPSSSNFV